MVVRIPSPRLNPTLPAWHCTAKCPPAWRSPCRGRRCNDGVALAASLQRPGDEARRLHLVDERAEVACRAFAASGSGNRLLDRHEPALDHAHPRIALREL